MGAREVTRDCILMLPRRGNKVYLSRQGVRVRLSPLLKDNADLITRDFCLSREEHLSITASVTAERSARRLRLVRFRSLPRTDASAVIGRHAWSDYDAAVVSLGLMAGISRVTSVFHPRTSSATLTS